MKDLSEQSHYEVLELTPGCGSDDLAKAYLQAKERYGPGSLATYALAEPGETEALLRRIDEAFAVLSDPERRREYDSERGVPVSAAAREPFIEPAAAPSPPSAAAPEPQHPPIAAEPAAAREPVLAPAPEPVHIPEQEAVPAPEPVHMPERVHVPEPVQMPEPAPVAVAPAPVSAPPVAASPPAPEPVPEHKPVRKTESDLPADAAVTGDALRRVREARGLSLKDVEGRTKIGHWHLENIERERYADLPAQVYLRGFLMSLARELKLDPVRVARSYLEQMKVKFQAKPE